MNSNLLTIENNQYLITKQLGQGAYGVVYEGENQQTKQKVAIKIQSSINQSEAEMLMKMKGKKYKNLINTLHIENINNQYYIVMEYCQENLYDRIQRKGTIKPADIRFIMKEIANGIKEIHDLGYAHRDLKPENVLIFQANDIGQTQDLYKICDFGTIKNVDVLKTQVVGTAYYVAPEQINNNKATYTSEVDIWAFGALIYELLTGKPMFNGSSEQEVWNKISKITQNEIDQLIINNLRIERKYSTLLLNMLKIDINQRLSINKIINDLRGDSVIKTKPQAIQSRYCSVLPLQNPVYNFCGLPKPQNIQLDQQNKIKQTSGEFRNQNQCAYQPQINNGSQPYSLIQNQNDSRDMEFSQNLRNGSSSSQMQNNQNQNTQQYQGQTNQQSQRNCYPHPQNFNPKSEFSSSQMQNNQNQNTQQFQSNGQLQQQQNSKQINLPNPQILNQKSEFSSSQMQNQQNQNIQQLQAQVYPNQTSNLNKANLLNHQNLNATLQNQQQSQEQTNQSINAIKMESNNPQTIIREGRSPVQQISRQIFLSPQIQNEKTQVKQEFNNRITNIKDSLNRSNQISQGTTQNQNPIINQIQVNKQIPNVNSGLKFQNNNSQQTPNTLKQQPNIDSNQNKTQYIAKQLFQQQINTNNNIKQQNLHFQNDVLNKNAIDQSQKQQFDQPIIQQQPLDKNRVATTLQSTQNPKTVQTIQNVQLNAFNQQIQGNYPKNNGWPKKN